MPGARVLRRCSRTASPSALHQTRLRQPASADKQFGVEDT